MAWSVTNTPAHEGSKTCRWMTTQRVQCKVATAGIRAASQRFTAYGSEELCNKERCCYLGRVLSYDDNDVPVMRRNLKRARATWGRISKTLVRKVVPASVASVFIRGWSQQYCSTGTNPGSSRHSA